MKKYKRRSAALLSLLVALLLLPMHVFAAGSIDLNREVSLTISCRDGSTPLTGAPFNLYLVATVDAFGELTETDDFSQFNVDIRGSNAEAWKTLASTLEGYVLRDAIVPADSGNIDAQGSLSFPTDERRLTAGLYLVLGERHTQNDCYYDPAPCMVMLPGQDLENNLWNYDVSINAKYECSAIPDRFISRKVLKIWKDAGHQSARPQEVIIQLLRDGIVYDTVTLNAGNNWRYTWEQLDNRYTWTVAEKECKGYTVKITREGTAFMVTNTYRGSNPDTPGKPNLPQTGQLWWPVPVLLAAGLLLVVIGLMRRRGIRHE